jgi:peptidoglycan/xylan/chitin deacetylase (PgdA/CDA1 family)
MESGSQQKVPILITWDVDPDRWASFDGRQRALTRVVNLCEEFGIRSTFFFTANYSHEYRDQIKRIKLQYQEIGCHGLTHTDEEDYDRMPEDLQRKYIGEAIQKLAKVTGSKVRSFRSPRVKTSALTLRLLSEHGYHADSSVCSQRIDFLSSNLINPGWLAAPRQPYHPNQASAFKRGDLPIWELPVSAIIVPLISGSLNVFGLKFMQSFFRLLYAEAKRTGKPIVYLSHPTDLMNIWRKQQPVTQHQSRIKSILTHGFQFRRNFFRMDGEQLFQATSQLFAFMASFPGVKFMTCSEYIYYLESNLGKLNTSNS